MKLTLRHQRLTIGGLMVIVVLGAGLINWLRPISGAEAARLAERRFRTIPGADHWAVRYVTRASLSDGGDGHEYWIVNFVDRVSDNPLAQVSLTPRGESGSTVVTMPGSAAPIPAEFLSMPIPPPSP